MPDARWSNDVEQVKQNDHRNRYAHRPQQHCTHLILLGGNRCECFLGNLFWIAHNGAPASWSPLGRSWEARLGSTSSSMPNCRRNDTRPRESRDRIVPTGTAKIFAASS